MADSSFSITIETDEELMISMLSSLNTAIDDGLLTYEEAEQLLCDHCIKYKYEVEKDA